MNENKGAVAPTVIKSVTAILCSAVLALTSTTITGKVCDNKKEIAEKAGTSSSVSSGVADAFADIDDTAGTDVSTDGTDTSAADTSSDTTADDSSADISTDTPAADTSASDKKGSSAKEITLTSGLQSTNKAEVLKYYKLVAAKNAKGTYTTKMTMTSLDGGKGAVGSLISAFKPIAVSALEKNSTTSNDIPGVPDKIAESDWEKAVAVNDGTYTTITVQIKNQTDGANGKVHEGTVGRSIGVLDGVQQALDNLNGVSADFDNAKFSLVYDNAYIKVKVKNSTGEFVKGSCTWHYKVNVNMDLLTVKVTFISATLNGGKGTVDYTITY